MLALHQYLKQNEDRVVSRTIELARQCGYTQYASTQAKAWSLSIAGLDAAMAKTSDEEMLHPIGPDETYATAPLHAFAVQEARRHREQGVTLSMFIGLFKCYRQAYRDHISEDTVLNSEEKQRYLQALRIHFDHFELAAITEWDTADNGMRMQELQRRNRELTSEKGKYLALVESLHQPVVHINPDGNVSYIHWSLQTFGTSSLPGEHYYCMIPPETVSKTAKEPDKIAATALFPWLKQELEDFSQSDDLQRKTTHEVFLEGGQHFLEATMSRMLNASGEFNGTVLLLNDVTETKRQYTQDLTQQKLASLGELAAGIAHEINTPSQYIMSNLEFLRDILPECSDEDAEEMLAAVEESLDGAKRISEIVASMKRVAHSGTLEKTAVDINKTVADTATICRNEWKYHAELTLDLEDDLPMLTCMPGDIGQLFLNLIVNAGHAVAERFGTETEKGRILVKTRSREDGIIFSVHDNGSGIPDAIKDKIFNLFFSTKPAGKGSGQGLSIANSVVERHGGSIEFDSTPDAGTEFRVFLPFDPPERT